MRRIAILCLTLAVANACGGDKATNPGGNNNGGNNNGGATTNQISIGDNFYDPSATTVAAGTTVTWTWNGALSHNVTFDNANVGNSTTQTSGTFQKAFTTAGTYNYHCTVHGVGMSGTVVVQ